MHVCVCVLSACVHTCVCMCIVPLSSVSQVIHSGFAETSASSQQLESEAYLAVHDRVRIERSKDDLLSLGKK